MLNIIILAASVVLALPYPAFSSSLSGAPTFTLNSEDGQTSIQCKATRRPSGGPDWMVECGEQKFAVHLLVNKFPSREGGMRYQILYWVLDYNYRPDPKFAGSHHGTNLSFLVKDPETQKSIHIGQIVQTVWTLDIEVAL